MTSTKPVTLSWEGLRGGILSLRPDTIVEIGSPEIRSGDVFLLDGRAVESRESGRLELVLAVPGEHTFGKKR